MTPPSDSGLTAILKHAEPTPSPQGALFLLIDTSGLVQGIKHVPEDSALAKLVVDTDYVNRQYTGFLSSLNRFIPPDSITKYAHSVESLLTGTDPSFHYHEDYQIGETNFHLHIAGARLSENLCLVLLSDQSDVTGAKRYFEKAVNFLNITAADRSINVSDVAHELKQPLAAIGGFAKKIGTDLPTMLRYMQGLERAHAKLLSYKPKIRSALPGISDAYDSALTSVNESILHLRSLHDQFKHWIDIVKEETSRVEASLDDLFTLQNIENYEFRYEKANLYHDVIHPVLTKLNARFGDSNLDRQITINHQDSLKADSGIEVITDVRALQSIYMNFLSNAFRYANDNSKVTYGFEIKDGFYHFIVYNDGEPIPEADLPRVGEWGYRSSAVEKREIKGNGYGLYLVKQWLSKMGGELIIRPQRNGELGSNGFKYGADGNTFVAKVQIPPSDSV